MMVLRHLGPPSTTVTTTNSHQDDDRAPMDLSNKHHSAIPEVPRQGHQNHHHVNNHRHHQFLATLPRPLSSPRTPPSHTYILNNNNNNNNVINSELKCNSPHSSNSEENSPRGKGDVWRLRRKDLSSNKSTNRWREGRTNEDEINSHSSPDSGLHRDSPGEDEDLASHHNATTPPLRKQAPQTLIPLSIIRARYSHPSEGNSLPQEDDTPDPLPRPDRVLTKRARLEEMVTHIKSSKDRSRRNSGDDDTSSGGHATSSGDEVVEDGRSVGIYNNNNNNNNDIIMNKVSTGGCLNLKRTTALNEEDMMIDDEEPCNLVCSEPRGRMTEEDLQFDGWKGRKLSSPPKPSCDSLSPAEAAKLLGMDPETYQQQMMQLQLTSAAAMMGGDASGILKGMGPYPPWVYLGYYSQILQSFQAQEILRQYAMQSNNPLTPNVSQGEKSPSNVPRNLGSSRYNCQSPLSPASLSEGGGVTGGIDSDGSTVGQSTPGSANNSGGKRAPRAMTGRHVRTGTGASPSTLQTLRQKIEERQRIKAQQERNELLNQSNSKMKHNKFIKKSCSSKK